MIFDLLKLCALTNLDVRFCARRFTDVYKDERGLIRSNTLSISLELCPTEAAIIDAIREGLARLQELGALASVEPGGRT